MPWVSIKSPSKDMLEFLMLEAMSRATEKCHDCGVSPGEAHLPGCDVARCLSCGRQRLSCSCKGNEGDGNIWTGLWPGTIECFEYGLVCYWDGPSPIPSISGFGFDKKPRFSYNDEAEMRATGKFPKRLHSFRDFIISYRTKPELINNIFPRKRS